MNQYDIECLHRNNHACPNVRKGVKLLYRLMVAVNNQSDGWAYWAAPSNSAKSLIELLKTAGNLWHDTRGFITAEALKKAVAPIRRMVNTQKKKQQEFGNTFEFDVNAAME